MILFFFFFNLKKLILYQGNGHEADFDKDEQVFIMDVYNAYIYPRDMKVKSESVKSSQVPPIQNNKQLYLLKSTTKLQTQRGPWTLSPLTLESLICDHDTCTARTN